MPPFTTTVVIGGEILWSLLANKVVRPILTLPDKQESPFFVPVFVSPHKISNRHQDPRGSDVGLCSTDQRGGVIDGETTRREKNGGGKSNPVVN